MEMTRRTSKVLVPFALCAMGIFALVFTGCERKPEKQEPPRHAPESYMKDPVFRTALREQRAERHTLEKSQAIVVEKMTAMIEAKKAELKTDDLEKVRTALEKDPEWKSLYQRCLDANQAIKEHRGKTLEMVRERITPQKPVDGKISK